MKEILIHIRARQQAPRSQNPPDEKETFPNFLFPFPGKDEIRKALLKTWAELAGGLLVFKYVQMYWALEISETHKDRAYEDCKADLQASRL